jgi:hypothetical protein
MTDPPHPTAAMDIDPPLYAKFILNNSERISTKIVEKTFDITTRIPSEASTNVSVPYKGIVGDGVDYLQNDLSKITLMLVRIMSAKEKTPDELLKQWAEQGLSSSLWTELLTGVVNEMDIFANVNKNNIIEILVFIGRLAHTPPNALFQVVRSLTEPTNASRAWSAAHLAIGSWHAKVRRDAYKATQKQLKSAMKKGKQVQTTLCADENSQMTIQNPTPLVSPDPKTKVTFGPNDNLQNTKRPAESHASPDKAKKQNNTSDDSVTTPKQKEKTSSTAKTKTNKLAKDYLTETMVETRISYKFLIQPDGEDTSDSVALSMISMLLHRYQEDDPGAAILPWKVTAQDTECPITNPDMVTLMEVSKFRNVYTDRFRPKLKQNCWFRLAIAHTKPSQHLLSGNLSNMASWFDNHDSGAWTCTVQGSDDTVPVGELIYTGPFIDSVRVSAQIRKACDGFKKGTNIKFGCRVGKNSDIPLAEDRPRNWILAENQLVLIEADRKDAKRLKSILYQVFNKAKDFRKRPGQYNARFLPDKTQILAGTTTLKTRLNTLKKHAAVVQSLTLFKSTDIKQLDQTMTLQGMDYTLRSILHEFTFPLYPTEYDEPKALFHTVDYPSSGQEAGKGVVYFTAYHDQSDIGERLVAILPAFIHEFYDKAAAKAWFHAGALQSLGEVTFGYDMEGNWDGTWHTAEDDLVQDILDEDMGITFSLDNIHDIETAMNEVTLTTDEASFTSFGTALGAKAITQTQQEESVIPAVANAVAAQGGDGSAV